MKYLFNTVIIITAMFYITTTGCTPKDINTNQEELITTAFLQIKDSTGSLIATYTFKDLDGDGGNAPTYSSSGTINTNKKYFVNITLLNETVNPVQDVTSEILEEKNDHQFFYKTVLGSILINYNDSDNNGNPVGINTLFYTQNNTLLDTLSVILKHQPNKNGVGVSGGDITNAGGETDLEINLPIALK